jgi:hypothetical protein
MFVAVGESPKNAIGRRPTENAVVTSFLIGETAHDFQPLILAAVGTEMLDRIGKTGLPLFVKS